ncbi:putative F-box protein [Dorcoceras hygrometricum]|uniref:Putative F-box protein n=1 Tax=Dorcoceras hygrometricum TaxID=472368 RepID=A0A2Z7A5N1_9LAMI|nr:putative F-box protein [Dorcoceras hygrometricum]
MSLFDLQDVCIAIGSLATLDLPMVVDLIGIYVLKGPYSSRRRRLAPLCAAASCRDRTCSDQLDEEFPSVLNSSVLLVQADKGITDSACKNQLVMVSVQYGPFNTNIQIRSTTIGKSRVARDLITMHTSWRSNSDIACVTRKTHLPKTHQVLWPEICHTIFSSDIIGYPRTRASGESSTMKHQLLHASGPHPIPPPDDPN